MKSLKEDVPANSGGTGIAQGSAGASTGTVSGLDKKLNKTVSKRKSFLEFSGKKL